MDLSYVTYDYNDQFKVTSDIKSAFDRHGLIVLRNALSPDEVRTTNNFLENDQERLSEAYGRTDDEGRRGMMTLWNDPKDDITGLISRSEKIAGTMEALLGGEVYHYHGKLMLKEARTGGKHVWHQDYGYWYRNGCLNPDMGSVFIAIDKCEKANGCLEVIPGSHHIGRVDHSFVGEQTGADMERVEWARKKLGHVFVEIEPGDAIFFHSNVLHASGRNDSDNRRWVLIVAYNRADNDPVYEHCHHAHYTPLNKIPSTEILSSVNGMKG
eukprot:XP_003729355.1 PREDICTED: probable phytanoyl-CoA dioxygenase isoform X1 [Strongylocentrotus purpuratus]